MGKLNCLKQVHKVNVVCLETGAIFLCQLCLVTDMPADRYLGLFAVEAHCTTFIAEDFIGS